MGNLFRNLFVPQKNLPQFSQQAYRTDMQAIETWANGINISFDVIIGGAIPTSAQPTMQLVTFTGTAAGGIMEIVLPTPYKFGYTALVSSGDGTTADSAALLTASTLGILQVYMTLGGAPVSGGATVVYLIVGA